MILALDKFHETLEKQRGMRFCGQGCKTYNRTEYLSRRNLTRQFVEAHIADAKRQQIKPKVTIKMIAEMLDSLNRGYSLETDQISASLRKYYQTGKLQRYSSNSRRVSVDGKIYRSIRQASEREKVAIRTVTNRIASKRADVEGWKYTDG